VDVSIKKGKERLKKNKSSKKRVFGPYGLCGDLMMGEEEGCSVTERDGVEYVAHVVYGSCSIGNK